MPGSLSRVVGFRALHRFYRPEWTEQQNRATFGPLSDPPGHAHDYQCVVTVAGLLEPLHGMVMDLAELDRILQEEVVAKFDGRHLNLDVPEFAYGRTLPTCEAIAVPDINTSLDDEQAKRAFWTAFRALGAWNADQPPF